MWIVVILILALAVLGFIVRWIVRLATDPINTLFFLLQVGSFVAAGIGWLLFFVFVSEGGSETWFVLGCALVATAVWVLTFLRRQRQ